MKGTLLRRGDLVKHARPNKFCLYMIDCDKISHTRGQKRDASAAFHCTWNHSVHSDILNFGTGHVWRNSEHAGTAKQQCPHRLTQTTALPDSSPCRNNNQSLPRSHICMCADLRKEKDLLLQEFKGTGPEHSMLPPFCGFYGDTQIRGVLFSCHLFSPNRALKDMSQSLSLLLTT